MATQNKDIIRFKLIGSDFMLQHNGQLADPKHYISRKMKQITDKKTKKTDTDIDNLERLELMGGVYWHDQTGVYLPDDVLEGTLLGGARKRRAGESIRTGCQVLGNYNKLIYDGMEKIKTLEDIPDSGNHRFVKGVVLRGVRIMRARPIFRNWSVTFDLEYAQETINRERVIEYMMIAGAEVGLGDWRPKFGRFSVEVL